MAKQFLQPPSNDKEGLHINSMAVSTMERTDNGSRKVVANQGGSRNRQHWRVSPAVHRVNSLGEFIRARRTTTPPGQVGLPGGGPRRTAGLRREEVAALAGLSEGYYARLEQGRERYPSNQVLDALIRVFQLDAETAEHVYRLARRSPVANSVHPQTYVPPDMLRLISRWRVPAVIAGTRTEILAGNSLSAALFSPMGAETNTARFLFLNPAAQEFHQDRDELMRISVAILRTAADLYASDDLMSLVDELSTASQEFRQLWERYDLSIDGLRYKRFSHPEVGKLELQCQHFTIAGAPGQRLVVWQAEPGSPSQEALDFLRMGNFSESMCRASRRTHSTTPCGR